MDTIERHTELVDSGKPIQNRVMVAIPMTGSVRSEWVLARYGQAIPVNWSVGQVVQWFDTFSPFHFAVDAARNIAVKAAIDGGYNWMLFIDHDVILHPETFVKMNEYIQDGTYPVVSGLYAAKAFPAEPLLFRGRGNSWYRDWKKDDKVWVDGIPMGCALLNVNLLKVMWDESPDITVHGQKTREVFRTPIHADWTQGVFASGTEDLYWCDRVINEGFLAKAGYEALAKEKYPFLVDTSIWCGHITPEGRLYYPDTGR